MVIYNRDDKELTIPVGWGYDMEEPESGDTHYSTIPLTARVVEGSGFFEVKRSQAPGAPSGTIPFCIIFYSLNGADWRPLSNYYQTPPEQIPVKNGDIIRFKGYNLSYGGNMDVGTTIHFNSNTGSTLKWEVEGNIMSLCFGEEFEDKEDIPFQMDTPIFPLLFYGNVSTLVNAENLVLPCMDLPNSAYARMFRNCKALVKAPYLPMAAPSRVYGQYYEMFRACRSLEEVRCNLSGEYSGINGITSNWLDLVSSGGTFYGRDIENWDRGVSGIPEGWEIKNL